MGSKRLLTAFAVVFGATSCLVGSARADSVTFDVYVLSCDCAECSGSCNSECCGNCSDDAPASSGPVRLIVDGATSKPYFATLDDGHGVFTAITLTSSVHSVRIDLPGSGALCSYYAFDYMATQVGTEWMLTVDSGGSGPSGAGLCTGHLMPGLICWGDGDSSNCPAGAIGPRTAWIRTNHYE